MTLSDGEMLAACGLDCGTCPIRQIPLDADAAQGAITWFREVGWLQESEGIAVAIERKMYCCGCQGDRLAHWSPNCGILLCCVDDRHLHHCGQCPDVMSCERLDAFASDEHAHHRAAVLRLRERFGTKQ